MKAMPLKITTIFVSHYKHIEYWLLRYIRNFSCACIAWSQKTNVSDPVFRFLYAFFSTIVLKLCVKVLVIRRSSSVFISITLSYI